MTPISRLTRLARLALPVMTASCATSPPPSAEPPRLILPPAALSPCILERVPERPTLADLEVAYMARGAQLVACEAARAIAVETLRAERDLQDRWRRDSGRSGGAWRPSPSP